MNNQNIPFNNPEGRRYAVLYSSIVGPSVFFSEDADGALRLLRNFANSGCTPNTISVWKRTNDCATWTQL